MKVKTLLITLLICALAGAGSIAAESVYSDYSARKITVKVNGSELKEAGLTVNIGKESQSMASIQSLASSLGFFVQTNESKNTVELSKPNVQLFAEHKGKIFGSVERDEKKPYEISVFAQVDSLYSKISAFKISIVDPFGAEVDSVTESVKDQIDNFQYRQKFSIPFKYTGKYTVNFFMKEAGSDDYIQLSQMVIRSTNN